MTRAEFDQWVEEHYDELLAVARRRITRDHEDVVQKAVAGMLASSALATTPVNLAWTWAVGFVRGHASVERRSARRRSKNMPVQFNSEEKEPRDTRVEECSKLRKLDPVEDTNRWVYNYYLKKLERDRRDFDMDGYGRSKKDKPFEVFLPGEGA